MQQRLIGIQGWRGLLACIRLAVRDGAAIFFIAWQGQAGLGFQPFLDIHPLVQDANNNNALHLDSINNQVLFMMMQSNRRRKFAAFTTKQRIVG